MPATYRVSRGATASPVTKAVATHWSMQNAQVNSSPTALRAPPARPPRYLSGSRSPRSGRTAPAAGWSRVLGDRPAQLVSGQGDQCQVAAAKPPGSRPVRFSPTLLADTPRRRPPSRPQNPRNSSKAGPCRSGPRAPRSPDVSRGHARPLHAASRAGAPPRRGTRSRPPGRGPSARCRPRRTRRRRTA